MRSISGCERWEIYSSDRLRLQLCNIILLILSRKNRIQKGSVFSFGERVKLYFCHNSKVHHQLRTSSPDTICINYVSISHIVGPANHNQTGNRQQVGSSSSKNCGEGGVITDQ